jgi:hypothetical protein
VNPADVAATHAYLEAIYAYEQVVATNAGASKAAFESAANAIAAECPAVLANMPAQKRGLLPEGPSPQAPRAAGEANRRERQLQELENELQVAPRLASEQIDRQAAPAFASAVASLSWSNPKITVLVRQAAEELTRSAGTVPPAVCADMRAWVASGYRTLGTGTKQFESTLRFFDPGALIPLLPRVLMKPYEEPAEKGLIGEINEAAEKGLSAEGEEYATLTRLASTLGIPSNPLEPLLSIKTHKVVLAHGRTATGERYTVTVVERAGSPINAHAEECGVNVEIETHRGNGVSFSSGGGVGGCAAPRGQADTSVNCSEGVLTIQASTLPRTRSVILHLSNGRTIASRPALLPRGRGGPGGLYYQAVRGPSPIPVSLTELDAHGHTLRSDKLARVVECTKPALRYLPGGLRTLVHAAVSQGGPAFSIVAQHYRFLGHTYFEMSLQVKPLGEGGFSLGGGETLGEIVLYNPGTKPKPDPFFSRQQRKGCQPQPYAIVYGLLKPPGATVTATVAGKTMQLRRVRIPASMHVSGALVYGVLPTLPEKLIVRSAHGKALFTESLGSVGKEATETCEGEAEG